MHTVLFTTLSSSILGNQAKDLVFCPKNHCSEFPAVSLVVNSLNFKSNLLFGYEANQKSKNCCYHHVQYPTLVCSDMVQQHQNRKQLALNGTFHGIGCFHIEMCESLLEQGNTGQEKRKSSEDHGNVSQLTCGVLHYLKFLLTIFDQQHCGHQFLLTNFYSAAPFSYMYYVSGMVEVGKIAMGRDALPFTLQPVSGNELPHPQIRR